MFTFSVSLAYLERSKFRLHSQIPTTSSSSGTRQTDAFGGPTDSTGFEAKPFGSPSNSGHDPSPSALRVIAHNTRQTTESRRTVEHLHQILMWPPPFHYEFSLIFHLSTRYRFSVILGVLGLLLSFLIHESIIDCGFQVSFSFFGVPALHDFRLSAPFTCRYPFSAAWHRRRIQRVFRPRPSRTKLYMTAFLQSSFETPFFHALIDFGFALPPILCGTIVREAWSWDARVPRSFPHNFLCARLHQ